MKRYGDEARASMAMSHNAGEMILTREAPTIIDAIAVRNPVPSVIEWLRGIVDDVTLVDGRQILDAMRFAHGAEPAGAGYAAALAQVSELNGARTATILCGANLTNRRIKV